MRAVGLILFLGIIAWISDWQARQFAAQKTISHNWWTVIFGSIILLFWVFGSDPWGNFFPLLIQDWLFLLDLILEHFFFFNPLLNIWRKDPLLYINSDAHGSKIDAAFIWVEDKIPAFYPICWAASGIAIFFITKKFL